MEAALRGVKEGEGGEQHDSGTLHAAGGDGREGACYSNEGLSRQLSDTTSGCHLRRSPSGPSCGLGAGQGCLWRGLRLQPRAFVVESAMYSVVEWEEEDR